MANGKIKFHSLTEEPTHESIADGHFGLPGRRVGRHGRDLVPRTE